MIREAVETLGPPGALPSQDAVPALFGPEPVHEASAIVEALQRLLGRGEGYVARMDLADDRTVRHISKG
jgi:hypothetical protein